ncbi:hypothetical protein HBA91_16285 [Ochrobactrum sp. MR34]|nr:hypothetical protein [Ochrobactrum sp. MR34]
MSQKAKGSAEAATSIPSQCSIQTVAGMKNMQRNNTKSVPQATTVATVKINEALFDLENPINDSKNMASILGSLLHDIFDTDHSSVTGNREFYFISESDASNIIFAAGQLQRFIKSSLDTWNEALKHNTGVNQCA